MIINDDQRDWAAKCPMVEFALNSSISATTGFTLFELNQGYMPQIGMPTRNVVLVTNTMWETMCIYQHRTLPYLKAGQEN